MKISAFMPLTNPEKRGDTYLEAIITHLYWADELIVVDGGSTDGSLEKIRAINDSRIRIVKEPWDQENWSWAQFAVAWNRGLKEATGDWVAAGETDHIFHENEAKRVRQEIERETAKGKAVMKIQKLQSADVESWQSKSQMYYFVFKAKYPQIQYGFSKTAQTDLAHPIWTNGETMTTNEGDIPVGEAVIENSRLEHLIGGTGANLYNYLWSFKTVEQVIQERTKGAKAWNSFSGFTETYNRRFPEGEEKIREWIHGQLASVRIKANRTILLDDQPKIMQEKIARDLKPGMIGRKELVL